MQLVTRAEWGARPPRHKTLGQIRRPSTAHWNGPTVTVAGKTTWDHSKCAGLVRGIQNYHMDQNNWYDIAYNFIPCPHRYVFEGRGLNAVNGANGTNVGNKTSHAIMCIAGEGNPFPDDEKIGFRDCAKYIADNTDAPFECIGHRDHKSTACPGGARYEWVHAGMPVATAPLPNFPTFNPYEGKWSLYPFNKNKATLRVGSRGDLVGYLQGVITHKAGGNLNIDGYFGPHTEQRVKEVQNFFKVSTDGIVGPKTWGIIDFLASQ